MNVCAYRSTVAPAKNALSDNIIKQKVEHLLLKTQGGFNGPVLQFSNGSLETFKKRHGFRRISYYVEQASAAFIDAQTALEGRADEQNLEASLVGMERTFNKANFNDKTRFGLLRNVVMGHLDLAQFSMYRSPNSYSELKKAVTDIAAGRNAFWAAL